MAAHAGKSGVKANNSFWRGEAALEGENTKGITTMKFIKTPVKGMCDMLPADMRLREHVLGMIKETYGACGFMQIETPVMEHIENLTSKQGGDNEKLIFKVMKRGAELQRALDKGDGELADNGLRYDLTVPLARYYANNKEKLPTPFKAMQLGNVWRADNPQKGRFRQFTQCDIDILGEPSNLAEIELITATTTTIGRLGFKNFEIRINERRILKAMAAYSGFEEKDYDSIFITLDKMDKIGLEGVAAELGEEGYAKESIDKYLELFELLKDRKDVAEGVAFLKDKLGDFLDQEVADSLTEIATAVNATKNAEFTLVFDPTLVRGMSYYTGTIFEIAMPELGAACGGGGRYDKMIGKFTGNDVPACGFSIGFERIILLLMESGFKIPERPKRVAYLVEKKYPAEKLVDVMKQAKEARENGQQVLVVRMNKNKKFQKEQLSKEGYEEFEEFFNK